MERATVLTVTVLAAVAVLFFVMRSCGDGKPVNHSAAIDSLQAVYESALAKADAQNESLTKELVEAGQATIESNKKLDSISKVLNWFKEDDRRLAKNVINAAVANDTNQFKDNCLALAYSYRDSLYALMNYQQEQMNDLILKLHREGLLKDSALIALDKKSSMLRSFLDNSFNATKALANDFNRANKGKFYLGAIGQAAPFGFGPQLIYSDNTKLFNVGVLAGKGGAIYQIGGAFRLSFKRPSIYKLFK